MQTRIVKDHPHYGKAGEAINLSQSDTATESNVAVILDKVAQGKLPYTEQLAEVVGKVAVECFELGLDDRARTFLCYQDAELPSAYYPEGLTVEETAGGKERTSEGQNMESSVLVAAVPFYVSGKGTVVPGAGELYFKHNNGIAVGYVPASLSALFTEAKKAEKLARSAKPDEKKKGIDALTSIGLAMAKLYQPDFSQIPDADKRSMDKVNPLKPEVPEQEKAYKRLMGQSRLANKNQRMNSKQGTGKAQQGVGSRPKLTYTKKAK